MSDTESETFDTFTSETWKTVTWYKFYSKNKYGFCVITFTKSIIDLK